MALKAQQLSRRPAADVTRGTFDKLEARQLMAGYAANINFQFSSDAAPAGYTVDAGKTYAARGGKQFGWNTENWKNFTKTSAAKDVHSAYAKFGAAGQATTWEIAVPNGTYSVKIVAGDANAYTGKYAIKAENTIVVNAAPTSAKRFVEATATVIVKDGRLTLTSAAGAVGNKIDAVTLTQTSASTTPTAGGASVAPIAPSDISGDSSTNSVTLTWNDSTNESNYTVQRSTDGTTFTNIATLPAGTTSYVNTGLKANTTYYYRVAVSNAYGSDVGDTVTVRTDPAATPTPTGDVPDAPSDLDAWGKTGSSVGLDWTTVDGEQGYIVEQSTDGKTFAEAGRVGANVNYFAVTGLSANVKYSFRVTAYNAAGKSAASNVATFTITGNTPTPTPNPTPDPTPTPTPTPGGDLNSWALTGLVPNQISPAQAIPVLKALGMKSVRLWSSITDYSAGARAGDISTAQAYKNAGFTVTMAFVGKVVPTVAAAKACFQRLAASGLKNVVDYWEIGNEMTSPGYWNGSLKQYVTNMLAPAYEALHAAGEKVIGGGIAWDFNQAKTLQSYGYSNYCDYAGFHPYGESGAIVIQRARDARANFGNKPMIITEWNVQFVTDKAKWVKEINIAAAGLKDIAYLNYYYALKVDTTHVGAGGLIYSNGTKNTAFYDAVYSWVH